MKQTITILFFLIITTTLKVIAQLPTGFVDQLHSDGWNNPTGLVFDATGKMYVWEKDGKIYVVDNKEKTLLLDISQEVATWGDYGLLGFVLDPNYLNNGYVYLYYVVDRYYLLNYGTPDYNPSESSQGATIARVARYTIPTPFSPSYIDTGSKFILIGESISTGFPMTGTNHPGGGMAFGNDGSLFIGCGDGGLGDDYTDQAYQDGILSKEEYDVERPYRCQMLNSLSGKIVRINPNNGDGIDSNPFFDGNNNRSPKSRIWASGLRNPFRFTLRPNSGYPGVLYIGDVGWNSREELNIASSGGQNFGWPYIEGIDLPTLYVEEGFYPTNPKKPTVEWRGPNARVVINDVAQDVGSAEFPGNNFTGTCSIGGVWYTGTNYPEEFRNTYMFADLVPGWIKSFSFDNEHNPTSFRDLSGSNGITVSLAYNPADQTIYYIKLGFNENDPNEVRKLAFNPENIAPIAKFTYNPVYGNSPLSVSFDASSSTDYENSSLTYEWNFGDGSTGNGAYISHIFDNNSSNAQKYDVVLTVTDAGGLSNTISNFVSLNNTPPIIHSTSIDGMNVFANNGNDLIQLNAQTSDNQEPSNQLSHRWVVRLYHDSHSHPELDVTSTATQVNFEKVPCDGHTYFYRVTLIVTDSYGLSATFTKDIYPDCSAKTTPTTGGSVYLSDLTPIVNINGFGPLELDKSNGENDGNDGRTLTLNGTTHKKGLGVHAYSELVYELTPNVYNTFSANIGLDDESYDESCGSVIFKIFANNTLVYESPIMRPNSETIEVKVDLTNVSQLKLIVENAGDNDYCDHADWADAKLSNSSVKVSGVVSKTLQTQFVGTTYTFRKATAENESINIAPNPAHSLIEITLPSKKREKIYIFDELGKVKYESAFQEKIQLSVENWSAGTYIIRSGVFTKKFIIE
jgi:glucose/arabinose dehydrogenase